MSRLARHAPEGAAFRLATLGLLLASITPAAAGWDDNLRWTLDASSRAAFSDANADGSAVQALGLDVHKVFSGREGDIGTLILQPYLVWAPDEDSRPAYFDGDREVELTWRIANFNYRVLPRGTLNIRAGHFEVPFGLEHDINTNGTLRQYSNGPNLGLKADWGVSANGTPGDWHYEVGLTRGTGQEYHRQGDPYAFSGRIGSSPDAPLVLGLAAFDGRVRTPQGLVDRRRAGLDGRWSIGPLTWMAEVSIGDDDEDTVRNMLLEANWHNRLESVLLYSQVSRWDRNEASGRRKSEAACLGARWTPGTHLTLAVQFAREFSRRDGGDRDDSMMLQARYRL